MKRRTFLGTIAAGAGLAALGSRSVAEKPSDRLHPAGPEGARLEGETGARIRRVIENRIKRQDPDRLVAPFREREENRCWQTEFWGKWFLSAAAAYRYTGDAGLREGMERSVRGLLATQTADGYIGNYADADRLKFWDVWGRKYTLLGLLAWVDLTGDPEALGAARRLADLTIREVGPGGTPIVRTGNFRGMPSSSILEPVVGLYRRTGEEPYLDFARYIVNAWSRPDGPQLVEKALAGTPVAERFPISAPGQWWSWDNGQKAYEMMACYDGLLDFYRVDPEPRHLEAVLAAWQNILDTEINVAGSGATMECWYGGRARQAFPAKHPMETCVTQTWMKWNANLLRLTGEGRFADEIERSLYNALFAAMKPDGTEFAKYTGLEGFRSAGPEQCGMGLHCCTANGPRGMLLPAEWALAVSEEGPVVVLYGPGEASVGLPGGNRVRIVQETDYPRSGDVTLRVYPERPERFELGVRIPAWSRESRISVNDEAPEAAGSGTIRRIGRVWSPGDRVRLALDVRPRVVYAPGFVAPAAAVVRGPVVLARIGNPDRIGQPKVNAEGIVDLQPVERPGAWMGFEGPLGGGQHDTEGRVTLCDFASAGVPWGPENAYRTFWPALFNPQEALTRTP